MEEVLKKLSKEKLVGYFLILWGLSSFLINGLFSITYFAGSQYQTLYGAVSSSVGVIANLISIAAGIVLIILGYKMSFVKPSRRRSS